jgi:hypothetical protein
VGQHPLAPAPAPVSGKQASTGKVARASPTQNKAVVIETSIGLCLALTHFETTEGLLKYTKRTNA